MKGKPAKKMMKPKPGKKMPAKAMKGDKGKMMARLDGKEL